MMPLLSVMFLRAALVFLCLGFGLGGLLLLSKAGFAPAGIWEFAPLHSEWVLLGWTLQLAMGVAYWILPRDAQDRRPRSWLAGCSFGLLNLGLILDALGRFFPHLAAEDLAPFFRPACHLLVVLGVVFYAAHLWPRVRPFLQS